MLSFDSRAAQRRIESLPWVERASVERVLPDRLDVHVVERAPYAVWRLNGRHFLVDKAGRVLATVPSDAMPTLPRVAGEGAAIEAVRLYELLGSRPGLARQVEIAERVGGRRWTLHLSGGSTLQLPAQGEAEAIERGLQIANTRGSARSEIDLRVPGRPLVRAPSTGGEKAPQDGVATGGI
jgi:cell division protein FtsQ